MVKLNWAFLTTTKVRTEREAQSFLCFPLCKSLRKAALADNLQQIGIFQFNNGEFHIHYWTQAFSFHCYYKCFDKIYKCAYKLPCTLKDRAEDVELILK